MSKIETLISLVTLILATVILLLVTTLYLSVDQPIIEELQASKEPAHFFVITGEEGHIYLQRETTFKEADFLLDALQRLSDEEFKILLDEFEATGNLTGFEGDTQQ